MTPATKAAIAPRVHGIDARGGWQAACRVWDELLVQFPRDALALQWAQLYQKNSTTSTLPAAAVEATGLASLA